MKHVLVAGVSGAIGGAMAEAILARYPDSQVLGLCRNPDRVSEALKSSERVHLVSWDAEDPDALRHTLDALEVQFPSEQGIDSLIYAAGLLHSDELFPEKRLEEVSAAALAKAFAVNATGFVMLVRGLMPWFQHKRPKQIAAISAKVGSITDNQLGGWYAYRSSKAALNMLVRNLSVELPRRVKPLVCVALHPGTTESALSAPFQQSLAQLKVHKPEQTAENLVSVLDRVSEQDNGRFFSWDGSELPW